ncbi:MAG: divalent-cation tolerance protein CutA [Zoogloeaceae bacterium]|nr:divalent-cation tolerance protein CutA [Zoogloeaceae bacterium]
MPEDDILLVLTTLPGMESAERLAADVIEARLAACVQILSPCRSLYRWQGKVEAATEIPLLIKTRASRYQALEAALCAGHPYEIPEILAFSARNGYAGYLDWVRAETADAVPEAAS